MKITNHHANGVHLSTGGHLDAVVHHQIHKRIEPPQDALDVATSVQLHWRA